MFTGEEIRLHLAKTFFISISGDTKLCLPFGNVVSSSGIEKSDVNFLVKNFVDGKKRSEGEI